MVAVADPRSNPEDVLCLGCAHERCCHDVPNKVVVEELCLVPGCECDAFTQPEEES